MQTKTNVKAGAATNPLYTPLANQGTNPLYKS